MTTMRRTVQLLFGLWLFGASAALMLRSELGLPPWDVLHQGISSTIGVPIGFVVIAVSAIVMLLWIPLRQRPGIGTIANMVLVGLSLELTLAFVPTPSEMVWRIGLLVSGVILNGVATGLYVGARLGPGPRDGLMTGLAGRGLSIRTARLSIEVVVLALGWILGGTVGVGTLVYAAAIGPLAHFFLPLLTVPLGETDEASHDHRKHSPETPRRSGRSLVRFPSRRIRRDRP